MKHDVQLSISIIWQLFFKEWSTGEPTLAQKKLGLSHLVGFRLWKKIQTHFQYLDQASWLNIRQYIVAQVLNKRSLSTLSQEKMKGLVTHGKDSYAFFPTKKEPHLHMEIEIIFKDV